MPGAKFFQSLGLFTIERFLDAALCSQIRAQMSAAQCEAATIVNGSVDEGPGDMGALTRPGDLLDTSVRTASSIRLEGPLADQIKERLLTVMPALEKHFSVSLTRCQGPEFLKYDAGAFYKMHRDGNPRGRANVAARSVSAVIFLNRCAKEPTPDCYGGGSLTFYGLLKGAQWENCAFPLEAEPGSLVAFGSHVLHEVQPVTFGQRFTIASWFLSPKPQP